MNKPTIALFMLIILFSAGCTQQAEQKKEPLKIAINPWSGYAYAFVAKEKGFFEKNGVEVELVYSEDYSTSLQLYKLNKVDGIFEVYSDAIYQNAEEKIPTNVVYVIDYSDGGDVIIGKSEFNSISDLNEKKIGIGGPNSFSHMFVLIALNSNNISESDVSFVDVSAEEVLTALEANAIDAGHTWEPTSSEALAKGYIKIAKAGDYPGAIIDVLAFRGSILSSRKKDVQAVVNSLVQAQKFLVSNRQDAVSIMAKAENMSVAAMESGLEGIHILDLGENIKAMKKSDAVSSLYGSGDFISNFYLGRGMISSTPDLDSIIDPYFVNNAKK